MPQQERGGQGENCWVMVMCHPSLCPKKGGQGQEPAGFALEGGEVGFGMWDAGSSLGWLLLKESS